MGVALAIALGLLVISPVIYWGLESYRHYMNAKDAPFQTWDDLLSRREDE